VEKVQANILGREYALACAPEEKETLEAAVTHVGRLAGQIQANGKVTGNEKIAVMAAIQLAAELLVVKAPGGPMGDLSVGDFKRKIDDMMQLLDSVEASPQ
jgi:cell division protein ZapA